MRFLALAAVVLLVACDSGNPEPAAVEIRTDQRVYDASPDLRIEVSAVNVSARSLYYFCNGSQHMLERMEGDEWVEVGPWYGRFLFYCDPSRIEPGEVVNDIPPITRPEENGIPLPAGRYRIQSEFFEDERLSIPVPSAEIVSVPFEVR